MECVNMDNTLVTRCILLKGMGTYNFVWGRELKINIEGKKELVSIPVCDWDYNVNYEHIFV